MTIAALILAGLALLGAIVGFVTLKREIARAATSPEQFTSLEQVKGYLQKWYLSQGDVERAYAPKADLKKLEDGVERLAVSVNNLVNRPHRPTKEEVKKLVEEAVKAAAPAAAPAAPATIDHDTERRAKRALEVLAKLVKGQKQGMKAVKAALRAPLETEIAKVEAELERDRVEFEGHRSQLREEKRRADVAAEDASNAYDRVAREPLLPEEHSEAGIEAYLDAKTTSFREKAKLFEKLEDKDFYEETRRKQEAALQEARRRRDATEADAERARDALNSFTRDRQPPAADKRLRRLREQMAKLDALDSALDEARELLEQPLRTLPNPPPPPLSSLRSSSAPTRDDEVMDVDESELAPSSVEESLASLPAPPPLPDSSAAPAADKEEEGEKVADQYCKNCGTGSQETAKFCPKCGKPLAG